MKTNIRLLRRYMKKKKVNYVGLADKIGISISYFSKKINGTVDFKSSEIKTMVDFMEIPHDEIYKIFLE